MSSATELLAVELRTLAAFRRGDPTEVRAGTEDDAWVAFGLRCLLEAGRVLRLRATAFDEPVERKDDGSPATRLEHDVERDIRERLRRFEPRAAFVGEETGGDLPRTGLAVAVDPVDGTWAFLAETPTWASVLAVFRDGQPRAGFVANPMTGELAYSVAGRPTRCLRVSAFGEPDVGFELPTGTRGEDEPLVNFHPSRGADALERSLHDAWERGELRMVRSPGGSPAWGLLEAARGHFVYVNAWSKRPSEPFDLAAGVLLVRGAGGEVTDAKGAPIDATRHAGPWIAAVDADHRARVAAIVADAWPE